MEQGLLCFNADTSIQGKFETFHRLNPHVYSALVDLARQLRRRGHQTLGIGMLFEVLRWQYMMRTEDPASDFKLSNSYRSRYARLIMDREPDLAGVFNTKQLRAA